MAKFLLTAVLPTVVTAASAGVIWLLRSGNNDSNGQQQYGSDIIPPNASLATTAADELSVVSWNVLADTFAPKLDYAAAEQLYWSTHRWPLIKQRLLCWGADLLLLQEVDVVWLPDWLIFAESAGYAAVYQETKGKQVVCMTLYKPSKLELWWSDTGRSRTLPAAFLFTDSSKTLQVLYTANCHLEGSPYKPAERLNQLRSTLASLAKHQAGAGLDPGSCHVLIGGDMNSCAAEAPYKLLAQGWLPAGYREAHLPSKVVVPERSSQGGEGGDVTQPYLLADVYAAHPLPFTRKVPSLASHLDWILASVSLAVVGLLWPLDDSSPGDRRLMHSRQGLPNSAHPSDHLPLGVKLRLLPSGALQE